MEQLGFEQPDHPLAVVLIGGVGVDVENHIAGGLVPGQDGVQPEAVEAHHAHLADRLAVVPARLEMAQRVPGGAVAGADHRALAVLAEQLHLAAQQVNGGVVPVALTEQHIAGLVAAHFLLIQQPVQLITRQGVHRHEGLQQTLVDGFTSHSSSP